MAVYSWVYNTDVYVGVCYILPEGSGRHGVAAHHIFNCISDSLIDIEHSCNNNCMIILLGDLNSRVDSLHDYVDDEFFHNLGMLTDGYEQDEH